MEWKGSGDGVNDGLVVENRTGEPKHVEVDCQTSKSTVFSGVTRLGPGEAVPYSDLPDRMIQVNVRAADGPKGRKMFDPEAVSGAIVVEVTDADVAFGTIDGPYDPATRDYTPSDDGHDGSEDEGKSGGKSANDRDSSTESANDRDSTDGTDGPTATGRSAASTADRERGERTASANRRDASGASSSADPAEGASSQTARSRSTGGTSARSGSEAAAPSDGAAGADDAGRTTADGADGGGGRRSTPSDASPPDAAGDDGDEPGTGEIYCRSCGEIIKAKAELCPECGVRNVAQGMRDSAGRQTQSAAAGTPQAPSPAPPSGGTQPQPAGGTQPQPSPGDRTDTADQPAGSGPSGAWVNGVRIGGVLWLLVLLILVPTVLMYQDVTAGSGVDPGSMLRSLGLATLLPAVQLLAWIVLPLSLYFDLNHIGYRVDEWPLHGRLYIAAALVLPIFTQIFGAAALFVGGGSAVAAVIPVIMLGLCIRHLRTRSRLL